MLRTSFAATAAALALLIGSAAAQQGGSIVIPAHRATKRGNAATSFPFHVQSPDGERQQWIYGLSELAEIPDRAAVIRELSVRHAGHSSVTLPAFCFDSVRIRMALSRNGIVNSGILPFRDDMDENLRNSEYSVEVRHAAPWRSGPVPSAGCCVAPFTPLELDRPFPFVPADAFGFRALALIIDIEVRGGTLPWTLAMDAEDEFLGGQWLARTIDSSGGQAQANRREFAPVIKLDWSVPTECSWQQGVEGAFLDVNRITPSGGCAGPLRFRAVAGQPFEFRYGGTTLAGHGYEILLSTGPVVSGRVSGLQTAAGQFVNLDPTRIVPLHRFTFPPLPNERSLQLRFPFPVPALSAQLLVLDPSAPDGIRLTPAIQIEIVPGC